MSNNKQTAVEWLVEKLQESGIPLMTDEFEMIQQAKQMEKEQIEDAIIISEKEHIIQGNVYPPQFVVDKAKRYYKKTYGGSK
jgi:hypothetical protein